MDNLNFQIRYGIFSDAVDSIFELNIVFMVDYHFVGIICGFMR